MGVICLLVVGWFVVIVCLVIDYGLLGFVFDLCVWWFVLSSLFGLLYLFGVNFCCFVIIYGTYYTLVLNCLTLVYVCVASLFVVFIVVFGV